MDNDSNEFTSVPSRKAPFDVEVTNQLHSMNFNIMQTFHRQATTNILLLVIAFLLCGIVVLLYQQRPITMSKIEAAAAADDRDKVVALIKKIPLSKTYGQVDVNVQNSTLDVEVTNPYLTVEIDR